jgi:hypothetical protein
MALKAPLIIGLAVAALVGVQAASAQSPSDASERAKLGTAAPSGAFERTAGEKQLLAGLARVYRDAHGNVPGDARGAVSKPLSDSLERSAIVAQPSTGAVLSGDSHGRVDLQDTPAPATSATSGREIEWPQIGIGFGLGIVLAFGLLLAVRATRVRPLAH